MTIWKYILQINDIQFVELPKGAKLLDVQMQDGNPCLWALIEQTEIRETRAIYMRGTGHDAMLVKDLNYVATFQMAHGALVFHVFA